MKYTDTFKAIAKSGNLAELDRLLFEMPPMPSNAWLGFPNDFMEHPGMPPFHQGPFADMVDNINFIVELMKECTVNNQEVVKKLITSMTILQSDGNIRMFLDLLNQTLNKDKPAGSHLTSLSSWAIKNNSFLLDLPLCKQDLYETHVKEMVLQAIKDNDIDALENLMVRHAKTLPDQLQPSMLESMKEYIPMWAKSMLSPSMAWLLGERVKFELCAKIDDPNTSFECKRVLAPYSIEQKVLGYSFPHNSTTTSKEIASDIARYKLTDNPRVMRALKISQLLDAALKGDLKVFNEKLAEVKDSLDIQALYKIFNVMIVPGVPYTGNNQRTTLEMAERLLEATQPLYENDPEGLVGLWGQFMADGYRDLLYLPGVMPAEIPYRDLKNMIRKYAEIGDVEALELLVPYAHKQGASVMFGEGELNLGHLDKNKTSAVIERLENLTIATKRPAAMVSVYPKSSSSSSSSKAHAKDDEPAERSKNRPKK